MIDTETLQALRRLDEVILLELLEVNSDELVDAFLDKIEENLAFIQSQLDDKN